MYTQLYIYLPKRIYLTFLFIHIHFSSFSAVRLPATCWSCSPTGGFSNRGAGAITKDRLYETMIFWEVVTRYTLDRRPWHKVGILVKKTQCFLRFLVLDIFQTTAKRHFTAFFHQCFKSRFSSSNKRRGVAGPRLCLQTH